LTAWAWPSINPDARPGCKQSARSGQIHVAQDDHGAAARRAQRRDDHGVARVGQSVRRIKARRDIDIALFAILQAGDLEFHAVHLNPQVRDTVMRMLSGSSSGNIHLIAPLSYLPFVALMERATLLITDSGGVQEEAPALGKPVLVTRDTTERPEALTGGTVKLVGADRQAIVREASRLLSDAAYCHAMSRICLPYGDGKATQRILDAIAARFDVAPVQQEELLPVAVGQ